MTTLAETSDESDVFNTPKGKDVELKVNMFGHWYVTMKGVMPKSLAGSFTTFDRCERAVELWLASLPPLRVKDEPYKPKGIRSKNVNATSGTD